MLNVWLGTSVEDQARAKQRIPWLLMCPAAVRFLSCEPLLEPVDISPWLMGREVHGTPLSGARTVGGCVSWTPPIDWVIVGGESGPAARPMHPDWVRGLRDQCWQTGIPFFFEQWGEWTARHAVIPGGKLRSDREADRVRLIHVGNETMMEVHAKSGGRSTLPRSMYVRRVGKKAAGLVLDGRTWDEVPQP